MKKISYIDDTEIKNKRVILRANFDVSLNPNATIAEDLRIKENLPTINYLLKQNNRIICIAKLGRPVSLDPKLSLKIIILENIRFYPEEKKNDMEFAKKIASLGDVYVNDCFAMCHRAEASIVSIPLLLPSYAGLALKSEIEVLSKAMKRPKKPLVVIIGGSKISTKIGLINKLVESADYVLLGGGLANVFFRAQRYLIGQSICEYEMVQKARQLLFLAAQKHTAIILPTDVIIGDPKDTEKAGVTKIMKENHFPKDKSILDIGPETKARFGAIINKANTIIWNGPVGMFENHVYKHGTDFIYHAIAQNPKAVSIVGGGDTLAAISKKEYLDKISFVSTGGGAMLEFIEKGTLPGIEVLKH